MKEKCVDCGNFKGCRFLIKDHVVCTCTFWMPKRGKEKESDKMSEKMSEKMKYVEVIETAETTKDTFGGLPRFTRFRFKKSEKDYVYVKITERDCILMYPCGVISAPLRGMQPEKKIVELELIRSAQYRVKE